MLNKQWQQRTDRREIVVVVLNSRNWFLPIDLLKQENQTAMTTSTRNGTGPAVQIIHPLLVILSWQVKQNVKFLIWPTWLKLFEPDVLEAAAAVADNKFVSFQKELYIKFYKFLVNLTPEDRKMGMSGFDLLNFTFILGLIFIGLALIGMSLHLIVFVKIVSKFQTKIFCHLIIQNSALDHQKLAWVAWTSLCRCSKYL